MSTWLWILSSVYQKRFGFQRLPWEGPSRWGIQGPDHGSCPRVPSAYWRRGIPSFLEVAVQIVSSVWGWLHLLPIKIHDELFIFSSLKGVCLKTTTIFPPRNIVKITEVYHIDSVKQKIWLVHWTYIIYRKETWRHSWLRKQFKRNEANCFRVDYLILWVETIMYLGYIYSWNQTNHFYAT